MRLLKVKADGSFSLTSFAPDQIRPYAILSHGWEADNQDVTFKDLTNSVASSKNGYRKIQFCGEQARNDGLEYFWVDSCCTDKMDFTELSTAINSTFRWHQDSARSYVCLSDISMDIRPQSSTQWESAFR
ncbi:hypothetical protein K432DRAFT_308217 [Lepidopterella palustris CBS 459.81]|uniref:Heterokaryon incompatibility domain-containing protein n=1 Tax=Lepidopterella palustris CBS 459.81 TaxID=1314670 RepID=A0A8E2E1D4_9PEZI|nr:hypothetical protein K432DRAFT_308217 [Lepidopterella palustris CBS 459.81]